MPSVRRTLVWLFAVFLVVITIGYSSLVFWIIPTYVEPDKRTMASLYTGYAYTALTTLLTAEVIIHFVTTAHLQSRGIE
jgi:hypothetical protein